MRVDLLRSVATMGIVEGKHTFPIIESIDFFEGLAGVFGELR
jgi:hypothetical protein